MKRPYRALALLAAGVLVGTLAACGDPAHVKGQAGPAGVQLSPAATFPVTVETVYGEVTIKKQPTRVVVLGYGDADALAALGFSPIAMRAWEQFGNRGTGPWAEKLMTSTPQLIPSPQMNADFDEIGAVEKLKPDLILETDLHEDSDRYQRLAKIAPVISAPKGTGEFYSNTLEEQTVRVAQAMGVPQQGQNLVDDLKARVASVAEEHPEFDGKTISVGQMFPDRWFGQVLAIDRLKFFLDLGFRENPKLVDEAKKMELDDLPDEVDLTPTNFDALDADLVVIDANYAGGAGGKPETGTTGLVFKNKRFAALPATRDGRSLVFDADPDHPYWEALDRPSVLSRNWLLDTLVPDIAERLD
jgi:iron complex transport system substrate-binding protein